MPIYRYTCSGCGIDFSKLVRSPEKKICCPQCGSEKIEKIFSRFSSPGSGCFPSGGG